ncbi:MAG: adenylate/guanylate cyclase domain-containing protein, partial [Candidatus Wallbacteria bacterium]|nr:adenylate/guanylate cyclase domain-containing protein [Candidatus Wallbacteria bacterium]
MEKAGMPLIPGFCYNDGMTICADCRRDIPADSNFCPGCGAKISSVPVASDELKLVTMMFADVSGFTAMSEKLSPDEVKEIMDDLFGRLTRAIESENGTVIKYEGDCIMAGFGMQRATDMDPAYACYAALKMQAEIRNFSEELEKMRGFSLAMRIGMHTGKVVLGQIGGRMDVLGDAVNLAARMEQNAEPGSIMVTNDLVRLLKGQFEVMDRPEITVKGKSESVTPWIVMGKAVLAQRKVLGRTLPLIGRDVEFNAMTGVFRACRESGQTYVILVRGEAGVGKSRLMREFETFLHGLEETVWLNRTFFNSVASESYHVFRVFLAARLDKAGQDLEAFFTEHCPEVDASARAVFVATLSALTGLTQEPAAVEGEQMKKSAFRGFQLLFQGLCRIAPVVFVIEDLHRADEGSLELIRYLTAWCEGSLTFALTARPGNPEFETICVRQTLIDLQPLGSDSVELLITEVAGTALPEITEKIVRVSGGNPFFIEEFLTMLHVRGVLREEQGRLLMDGSRLERLEIPDSLTLLMQEKVENLDRSAVEFLKAASVMGRTFIVEAAGSMDGAGSPDLEALLLSGLLLPDPERNEPDIRCLMFNHDLLRDAFYDRLTKKQKSGLHQQAGAWIEDYIASRPGQAARYYSELALHFSEAHDTDRE